MNIKRLICIGLATVLLLCSFSACKQKNNTDKANVSSGASDNSWDVPIGKDADKTEDFDNAAEDIKNNTPGQNIGTGGASGVQNTSVKNDEELDKLLTDFPESELAAPEKLLYYYEGSNYSYGITQSLGEIIAFRDRSGKLVDAIAGGGLYSLASDSGRALVNEYDISSYSESVSSRTNETSLIVKYKASGRYSDTTSFITTYTFHQNYITVSAEIAFENTQYTLSASRSSLNRVFLNDYASFDKGFNTDWEYPADGDDPYKTMDAWYTEHTFDKNNRMYTYLRSSNIPDFITDYYTRYPETALPVYFSDGTGVSDAVVYDLVFENVAESENPKYRALFAGKNSPIAAGVEPIDANTEASSVFKSDSVKLNLNVTNITDEDVLFSVRYDIRDYYGNIVSSGLYVNSTVYAGIDANRVINFEPSYHGIFFLNMVVVTDATSTVPAFGWKEYYPFALIGDYVYTSSETSPFGIAQILGGANEPYQDYLTLAGKIGVAFVRATPLSLKDIPNSVAWINKAKEEKMRIFGTGQGSKQYIDTFAQYGIKEFVTGNEQNLEVIQGADLEETFSEYYKNFFVPGYNNVKLQGYKSICSAISNAYTPWYEKLSQYWDKFDTIALHPYGYPYSPDLNVNTLWHVESALKRHVSALKAYGDKETYVTETGYPTPARNKTAVGLRTQADYNIRCYMLCLAYGVEDVMAYCFTDYSNKGVGIDPTEVEFNFGCFYYPDYYGRILPKPSAIAYANMTRLLESVKPDGVKTAEKYDDGNSVRAFAADTADNGVVTVAWSNCARLSNDEVPINRPDRPALRPWQNQWTKSQVVAFDTDKNSVKVIDTMGNSKTYTANNGKVSIELNGAPVFILGVK